MLAQNAKAAGINISLRKVDISDLLQRLRQVAVRDRLLGRAALPRRSPRSTTGPARPSSTRRTSTTRSSTGSSTRPPRRSTRRSAARSSSEMQKIQFDRGGNLIWSFQNTVDAYSTKVAGYPAGRRDRLGSRPLPARQAVVRREPQARRIGRRPSTNAAAEALPLAPATRREGEPDCAGSLQRLALQRARSCSASRCSSSSRPRRSRATRLPQILGQRRRPTSSPRCAQELGLDQPAAQPVRALARGPPARRSLGDFARDAASRCLDHLDRGAELARARGAARPGSRSRSRCCSGRSPPCAATAPSTTPRSSCCSC